MLVFVDFLVDSSVAEYSINNTLLVDCDLARYPSEKASLTYTIDNSPLVFENYITYNFGEGTQDNVVENKFYVSAITNYAKPYMIEYVKREHKPCQNVTDDDSKKYNDTYPIGVYDVRITIDKSNCFYLQYKKYSKRKLYKKGNDVYYYNYQYDGYTKSGEQDNSGLLFKSNK